MPSALEIRPFGLEDVDQAVALSDAAGWNQVPADWRRIVEVEPDGCIGGWAGDRLVGTTTFVTYGTRLAWIGMVLVHPEHRRQGIARQLFQHIMDELERRRVQDVGLDATDLGRPLYLSEGFVDVEPIVRWQGVLETRRHAGGSVRPARFDEGEDLAAIAALDEEITGVDRRALLEHLAAEERVTCFISDDLDAYAFVRPGRLAWQVGPLVAPDRDRADALLGAASEILSGREVVVDSPAKSASDLLKSWGMAPHRRLMRMTYRRECRLLTDERVPAAMSFAWG